MQIFEVAQQISKQALIELGTASESTVEQLRTLGAPQQVLDFYRQHDPRECAQIKFARLWPAKELIEENTNYVPGADLRPRGLFVVGTTGSGDAYCIDLRPGSTNQVVLMSHEINWAEASDQQIDGHTLMVAGSFHEFLRHFANGTLQDEPLHSPRAA